MFIKLCMTINKMTLKLKAIILLTLLSFSVKGQTNTAIDTLTIVNHSKQDLIKFYIDSYGESSTLNLNWSKYQILTGKSLNCDDKPFSFIIVGFVEERNAENHYGFVTYEVNSLMKPVAMLECGFTIESPEEVLNSINENYHRDRWGCDL